jgi:hypothetical protein
VHETGNMAGLAAHRVAGIARSQGAVLADAAARRTLGATRAVRNDPLPVVMGMIAAICLARLLLGGRRRHRQG